MRSFEQANSSWHHFLRYRSLEALRQSIREDQDTCTTNGIRSLCWKAVLLCESVAVDTPAWSAQLQSSRSAYSDLRSRFMRTLTHADELDETIDPLAEDVNSPWNALRSDEAARQEILQDVDRCMPDNYYFRQPTTKDMMLDILFVWAKLHPDTGYRQGMHEVLAPILWTMERDAIDPSPNDSPLALSEAVFDATFIEHDSFAIFQKIMDNIKSAYVTAPVLHTTSPAPSTRSPSRPPSQPLSRYEAPMIVRGRRIIERDLATVDPPLAQHLISIEIIPQVFLMRWLRLLFGREFPFDETLLLWDALFVSDPSLQTIDLICVCMLLCIRWQLIESDYNAALAVLLRYPTFSPEKRPASLVSDALYLKSHFNFDGGYHIIGRATGRPPPLTGKQESSQSVAHWTAEDSVTRPLGDQSARSPRNLENLVQDAARSIFARGEMWGVGRAVREAVGEVRKNVSQLQAQARAHSRNTSTVSNSTGTDSLLAKIRQLEKRNKQLGKMLEGAVEELWKHQKIASEGAREDDNPVKELTMAIAKVQLAQVYLDDPTLPLSLQEEGRDPAGMDQATGPSLPENAHQRLEESGEVLFDASTKTPTPTHTPTRTQPSPPLRPSTPPAPAPSAKHSRPNLGESSFSWMLGQDETGFKSPRSTFISASPFTSRDAPSQRNLEPLFGESVEHTPLRTTSGSISSTRSVRAKAKSKTEAIGPEDDIFDLSNFSHGPGPAS